MFIDANIFLEFFLNQEKAGKCESFFLNIHTKHISCYISDFIMYTCLLQLERKGGSKDAMESFIFWLLSFNHLTLLKPSVAEVYLAIEHMKKLHLSFDDALVVSCMEANNIKTLVSFDSHFDAVKNIQRIEP